MMSTGDTEQQLQVSFPASPTFSRIGRVTVAGLGLRLGVDVAHVERLRNAVDLAVDGLNGPGRIAIEANWQGETLEVRFANESVRVSDRAELETALKELLGWASVSDHSITFRLTPNG